MKFIKNKTAAISIAILLMLSIGGSLLGGSIMTLPSASAHTPAWQIPTYAYINVAPDPIGVGQTAQVYIWLDCVYGEQGGTNAQAVVANNYRFNNFQVVITSPSGATETKTFPTITDTTSSTGFAYTPTETGTYNFTFTYPGQVYGANGNGLSTSVMINDTYLPSHTSALLTVQQSAINEPTLGSPMPSEYWTRPIYGQNTDWWTVSSNWLGIGSAANPAVSSGTITAFGGSALINRFPGDAVGPLTSHVMWTKPIQFGGVVGGNDYPTQGVGWFEGSAYNNRFTNPIILNGYLYYTEPVSFSGVSAGPTDCVDLRTGQVIWSRTDVPALSFGYIYNLWDPNQHGVFPAILFTSNFARAFDAYTGDPLFNVTGVPSGTTSMGPSGEQVRYVITNTNNATNPAYYLAQWNSSRLWAFTYPPGLSPTLYNMTTVTAQNNQTGQVIGAPGNLNQ